MRTTFVLLSFLLNFCYAFASTSAKQVRLRIQDGLSGFADDATVYLDAGVSTGYLYSEDVQKVLNANTAIPQIYTLTSDSVACLFNENGPFTQEVIIPVGFKVGDSSIYRISANLLENFESTTVVRLEDRQLGVYHDLRMGLYSFIVNQAMQVNDRFFLHISYPTVISTVAAGCANNNGKIMCAQDTSIKWSSVQLYNASNTLVNTFYNISGNFEFTLLAEGNYTMAFSYNAYATSVPVALDGNQVTAAISISSDTVVTGQTVYFSASATNTTNIFWEFGDGTAVFGVANPDIYYSTPGNYTVLLTCSNSFGCQDTQAVSVVVLDPNTATGIEEDAATNNTLVVANDQLQVKADQPTTLYVYNLSGQLLINQPLQAGNSTIAVGELPAGTYLAALQTATSRITRKFVQQH